MLIFSGWKESWQRKKYLERKCKAVGSKTGFWSLLYFFLLLLTNCLQETIKSGGSRGIHQRRMGYDSLKNTPSDVKLSSNQKNRLLALEVSYICCFKVLGKHEFFSVPTLLCLMLSHKNHSYICDLQKQTDKISSLFTTTRSERRNKVQHLATIIYSNMKWREINSNNRMRNREHCEEEKCIKLMQMPLFASQIICHQSSRLVNKQAQ